MGKTLATMKRMYELMTQLVGVTHGMVGEMDDLQVTIHELRDHLADFDDFFRPIRNYFYWEPHCYNIPVCHAIRSIFDTLDGVSELTDSMDKLIVNMHQLDALMPQMVAQFGPMIATMENMQRMMLTTSSTMSGMYNQMDETEQGRNVDGKGVRRSEERRLLLSPARSLREPRLSARHEGLSIAGRQGGPDDHRASRRSRYARRAFARRADQDRRIEAVKGTPLEDAKISLGGTAATFKDMADGSKYDLLIAGIASICLIFLIMLLITKSLVAALVIVGTVVLSLGASFGISVLIWQHILGIELHWMVLAMAVIILLAVGSDYNLLLVSRFKEEIPGGLKTGIIRAMGGTGSVVTAAGLVFALTMCSMVVAICASSARWAPPSGSGCCSTRWSCGRS